MLGPRKPWLQRLRGTWTPGSCVEEEPSLQTPFLHQILSLDIILITSPFSLSLFLLWDPSSHLYHLPSLPASPPLVSSPPSEEGEGEEVTQPPEGKCSLLCVAPTL